MLKALRVKQEVMKEVLSFAGIIEDHRKEKRQLEVNRSAAIRYVGIFIIHAIDDRIAKLQSEIDYWTQKLIAAYENLDNLNAQIMYVELVQEGQRYNNRKNKRQRIFESLVGKNERMIG